MNAIVFLCLGQNLKLVTLNHHTLEQSARSVTWGFGPSVVRCAAINQLLTEV